MDVGQVTQLGLAVAGFATGATGIVVAILNRRTAVDTSRLSQSEQEERQRQADLKMLYDGLWANVKNLEGNIRDLRAEHETKVKEHEATIATLRHENEQCWADRAQLTNQVTYQRMQLDDMRRRVAQLEKPDQV